MATGGVRRFISKLEKMKLDGKLVAVFDTYMGDDFQKATGKMEKRIKEKIPGLKLVAPGLSVMVKGMKGPFTEGKLAKSREFGIKMVSQLKG